MKKTCLNCRFARWIKNGSRRVLTHGGVCTKKIYLPNSYQDHRGDPPMKGYISKYTKPDCLCWERIDQKND